MCGSCSIALSSSNEHVRAAKRYFASLTDDFLGLLARRGLCAAFAVVVPHALGARALVLNT